MTPENNSNQPTNSKSFIINVTNESGLKGRICSDCFYNETDACIRLIKYGLTIESIDYLPRY